jgi:hypothetical protein
MKTNIFSYFIKNKKIRKKLKKMINDPINPFLTNLFFPIECYTNQIFIPKCRLSDSDEDIPQNKEEPRSRSSSPEFEIVYGKISRVDSDRVKIGHKIIRQSDLDYYYHWLNFLDKKPVNVCYRKKNNEITDIRLIGTIGRVVKNKFGFIKHPFYEENLYFKTNDIDNSFSNSFGKGTDVCFRVGCKGNRVWGMRIYII